jgi:hypothetical protein
MKSDFLFDLETEISKVHSENWVRRILPLTRLVGRVLCLTIPIRCRYRDCSTKRFTDAPHSES